MPQTTTTTTVTTTTTNENTLPGIIELIRLEGLIGTFDTIEEDDAFYTDQFEFALYDVYNHTNWQDVDCIDRMTMLEFMNQYAALDSGGWISYENVISKLVQSR